MIDLTAFVVNAAFAADAMPPPTDTSSALMRFLPLFLIFAVFYFLLIRPQQKKIDAQNAMVKALKKGDRVVTSGGLVGEVASFEGDDYVMLEIAEGVRVKVVRTMIGSLFEDKKADKK